MNLRTLKEFLKQPGIRIVPPEEETAERYGEVVAGMRKAGIPIPTNDLWIAATALETGARVMSFDSHFDSVPGVFVVRPQPES